MKVQGRQIPEECIAQCLRRMYNGFQFKHSDILRVAENHFNALPFYRGAYVTALIQRERMAGRIEKGDREYWRMVK